MKKEYEIKLTLQEIFEVLEILKLYLDRDEVDKDLQSAYDKLNIEIEQLKNFWGGVSCPRKKKNKGGSRPHAPPTTSCVNHFLVENKLFFS